MQSVAEILKTVKPGRFDTIESMKAEQLKAIFFDIDGTLIDANTKALSPVMLDTLRRLRENGVRLFLATGRHPEHVRRKFDGIFDFDGAVCLNGAVVLADGKKIREVFMDARDVAFVRDHVDDSQMLFLTPETVYCAREEKAGDYPTTILELPHTVGLEHMDPARVCQINNYMPKDVGERFMAHLPKTEHTRWCDAFADMVPKGSSKAKGIQAVLDYYGLLPGQVMAFGDGENDIAMFYACGEAVAMGNGSELVKAAADAVTGTVEEEGITSYLTACRII